MTLDEYIDKAKAELDEMRAMWEQAHKKRPEMWPMELDENEWPEQELSHRFE